MLYQSLKIQHLNQILTSLTLEEGHIKVFTQIKRQQHFTSFVVVAFAY